MADSVDVFDRAVRKKDSEFHFVIRLFTDCSIDCPLPLGSILRMNALQPFFPGRGALFWIEAIYAIPFLGQMQGVSSRYLPGPAPCVREPLRFRQITLALPQRFFRLLCCGDVDRGPDKFYEVARLVQDRMADGVEVLDRSVRKNNAVVHLKLGFLDFSSFKKVHNALPVLRMEPTKEEFRVRCVIVRLHVVHPIDFRRDYDCARCNIMSPAARVAQFLRLKQRFFTAAQLFLRALALGGVHHRSDKLELTRLISFSMSHNVDMFDRTIRHHQAIFMLKILSILRSTLNGLCHQGRVVRMNPLEDTFDGRYRRSVVLEDSKGFL